MCLEKLLEKKNEVQPLYLEATMAMTVITTESLEFCKLPA